ncbi:MAG: hypothetical protein K0U82_07815, partial [Planctomycetes bacterium]|nr:hypothetical protein [Planctomycetota bacterium]
SLAKLSLILGNQFPITQSDVCAGFRPSLQHIQGRRQPSGAVSARIELLFVNFEIQSIPR